jgi:hypothetical protein
MDEMKSVAPEDLKAEDWCDVATKLLEELATIVESGAGDAALRGWCDANLHKKVEFTKHVPREGTQKLKGKLEVAEEVASSTTRIGSSVGEVMGSVGRYKIAHESFREVADDSSSSSSDGGKPRADFISSCMTDGIVSVCCMRYRTQQRQKIFWAIDHKSQEPHLLMLAFQPQVAGASEASYCTCCAPCCE